TLHTMFYANEIRSAESAGADKVEVKEQERTLATHLIENLAAKFEPDKYRDTYQESLRALVAAKTAGREVTAAPHAAIAPVIDLMDALKKSLAKQSAAPDKKQPIRIVSRTKEPVVKQRKKA
ncbi:MAG: Ku protein, partial [Candidatus Acidiferrales bacterium]